MSTAAPPPAPRDPFNDPRLERPRSWWDDPHLSLDALSPGQRYTAAIILVLAVALMAFGVERDQGGGPAFGVPSVGSSRPTTAPAGGSPSSTELTAPAPGALESPALLGPLEEPARLAREEELSPTATTTTSPPPSSPATQPPEEDDPPEDQPPVPLPPLPLNVDPLTP